MLLSAEEGKWLAPPGSLLHAGRGSAEAFLIRRIQGGGPRATAGTSAALAPVPFVFYFSSQSLKQSGLSVSCWLSTEPSL